MSVVQKALTPQAAPQNPVHDVLQQLPARQALQPSLGNKDKDLHA